MKQVTQRLRNGRIELTDVPWPELDPNGVIVDVRASVLSVGTEKTKVATARSNLFQKARKRPEDVKKVIDKARAEGITRTVRAVQARLGEPSPLGYSSAGVVLAVGEKVHDLTPGDRVACGGDGFAVHAEVAQIPGQLCTPIPGDLSFVHAAFATVGSIAMQGVRQADVRLGERVGVIGLGLVGQLAAQMLRASGCVVTGIDVNAELTAEALANGSVDHAVVRGSVTGELPPELTGLDAVVITAATPSSDPVEFAASICRDRGRVVVVGDVSLAIPREPYYRKELDLRLSRSYGPGRYDTEYEERGLDYPIGYVRWTERRNMAEFLRLAEKGDILLDPLITRTVPAERAAEVFDELMEAERSPIGIALIYQPTEAPKPAAKPEINQNVDRFAVGLLGAGNFASQIVAPGLGSAGFNVLQVASARGLSAVGMGERVNADPVDVDTLFANPQLGTIAIATRHSSHARFAVAAMEAGKAVFVEKPPAVDREGLQSVADARERTGLPVFVGFNRRYAPMLVKARDHIAGRGPIEAVFRVSSPLGFRDHWLDDPVDGGGRLIGEGCHFIDLACWLADDLPVQISALACPEPDSPIALARRFSVALGFADGSLIQIFYGAAVAEGLGKEQYEFSAGGRTALVSDFETLELVDGRKTDKSSARVKDKGHEAQFKAMATAVRNPGQPVPGIDPLATMAVTLEALGSAAGADFE